MTTTTSWASGTLVIIHIDLWVTHFASQGSKVGEERTQILELNCPRLWFYYFFKFAQVP